MDRQSNSSVSKIVQVGAAAVGMIAVTAALGGLKYLHISKAIAQHANFKMPPEAVTSSMVKEELWRGRLETVGSFAAVQGATLAAEEAGKVSRIVVESGAKVEKGQLLLELDTSVEEANLKGAAARVALARQNLARAESLRGKSAMSEATVDDALSKFHQAEAELASTKAIIDRKKIVAPFAGRVGIRTVNVGQYVAQGATLLPLFSVDPIYLNFSVPQVSITKLALNSKVRIVVDAFEGTTFEGTVTAINPNVDQTTRNVEVQATVANADERLKPGMFAKIQVDLGDDKKVVVIPSSGVAYAPYGDSVYVIEMMKDDKGTEYKGVRQQIIQLGEQRGDLSVVVAGLKAGEEVVTTGAFKLRPKAEVVVNNDKQPGSSANPMVEDS